MSNAHYDNSCKESRCGQVEWIWVQWFVVFVLLRTYLIVDQNTTGTCKQQPHNNLDKEVEQVVFVW